MAGKSNPIVLRNTIRRPLTFQVGGNTVRLSPGEQLTVPETWLGSAELRRFCDSGLVAAERASAAQEGEAEEEAGEEDEEDDESGTKRRRKSPKSTKAPKSKSTKPET